MQFLHPFFLLGLSAVAVPVIIHLVFKMKAPVVLFPSVRFLRQIDRKVAKRQKLQELLILLLRCLTLLLIVLALAGPVYKPTQGAVGSAGTAAVIILDDSCSMTMLDTGGPIFGRARAMAASILQTLHPGDTVCILTSNRTPTMSRDVGALEHELPAIEPSLGNGTLGPLVKAAVKLLRETECAQRELYVISDFQQRTVDLGDVDWKVRALTTVLVPVASSRRENMSIAALEQLSPFAATGPGFRVRALIVNHGAEAVSRNLKILVNDKVAHQQMVAVAGKSRIPVAADLDLPAAGWTAISAELDDDPLLADNKRFLSVEVRNKLSVLMCRPGAPGAVSRSFYLEKALNPGGKADTGVHIAICEPPELAKQNLADTGIIFLVESLPEGPGGGEALRVLKNFVAGGGSLVIVPGMGLSPAVFNDLLGKENAELGPLSPARFLAASEPDPDRKSSQTIKEISPHHPIFMRLARGDRPIDLGTAAFYRTARVEAFERAGARTLARFDSGDPAVVERSYGLGKVLLLGCSLHTDSTNLPLKVSFLPLVHSLVLYLTATERNDSVLVGENLRLHLPKDHAPASMKLSLSPKDTREAKPELAGGLANFDFGKAQTPGCFRMEWKSDKPMSRMIAVNVDAEEGSLDVANVAKELPFAQVVRNNDELLALLGKVRYGRNLSPFVFCLALLTLLSEALLANHFAFGKKPKTEVA